MRRLFMSPWEILHRSPEGGTGGGTPVAPTLKQVMDAVAEVKTEAEKQLLALQTKYDDLVKASASKTEIDELKASLETQKKAVEDTNKYCEQLQLMAGGGTTLKQRKADLSEEITSIIEKNWKEIQSNKTKKTAQEFDTTETDITISQKADMSFPGNVGANVARQEFNTQLMYLPLQVPHLRTFIPVGSTSAPVYWYSRGKKKVGSPDAAITAPGALKSQVEYDFTAQKVSVIKITAFVRLPEEMLEDIDGTSSFISTMLPEEVLNKEDQQIFNGTGEANGEFNGLFNFATTYVATAGVDVDENWDVIADAIAQQQNKRLFPTRGMVNPIDWMFLVTRKDANGAYNHPTLLFGTPLLIAGVPMLPHPEVPIDKFLIGKFDACMLLIKKGLTIRFFDQDVDNAVKNMITVVAEERAAFAVFFPEAFMVGDFGRVA